MKVLAPISTTFLLMLSLGVAAANTKPEKKMISAPAFSWGSPEDLNSAELELLKNRAAVSVAFPERVLGSADDLDKAELEHLKKKEYAVSYPPIVIGNPEDFQVSDLK